MLLYVERWLKAPMQRGDGCIEPRNTGTPQGGVISPLLANLFLHYAFDTWMTRTHPAIPFERYADDIICHCRTRAEADALKVALDERLLACKLTVNPQKTKIVYCKDTNRKEEYSEITFDFLGYTFRPRLAAWPNGKFGVSFLPGASERVLRDIRKNVRQWGLQRRSDKALDDLARMFNPYIRGWINYFGHFYRSALIPTLRRIDFHLVRWAQRKLKRFRQRPRQARDWLSRVARKTPELFAHWKLLYANSRMPGAVLAERLTYRSGRARW
ncbi:reverse transcriptase domain-containing protein [Roseiarcaceae bacterium H3SJ34-1]|uniref:reverse transcriptase domain-containing protein n=1 Tax=Terripilifer ovatus TaxID=3032367 RepID=UPI003AB947CC|nr:reverse transcriptase domain-containing protein [Roseiarcaceae bacterium H3SJ34-1]